MQGTKKKIAIVGTGSQWPLAPFKDDAWEIWGVIGVATTAPRLDRLYELHAPALVRKIAAADYGDGSFWKVARDLGPNFITHSPYEECPDCTPFDFQDKIARYGKYWGSSIDWLMADAIDRAPEEIGLFGINMAADSEYVHQKPSLSFYLGMAKAKGIKITMPSSSELLTAPYMYGLEEMPRVFEMLMQRKAEYSHQIGEYQKALDSNQVGLIKNQAYLEIIQYIEQNMCSGVAAYHNESKTQGQTKEPTS